MVLRGGTRKTRCLGGSAFPGSRRGCSGTADPAACCMFFVFFVDGSMLAVESLMGRLRLVFSRASFLAGLSEVYLIRGLPVSFIRG